MFFQISTLSKPISIFKTFFRQINSLCIVIYLVNALLSRNFFQKKNVKVNFCNFHTVALENITILLQNSVKLALQSKNIFDLTETFLHSSF